MTYTLNNEQNEIISTHDTYDEAVDAADKFAGTDGVVGHSGDLSDGGDRTLIWPSEEEADNDDGANAIGSIRKLR